MRSTKSIRRDIQHHVMLFVIALGIGVFFVIACCVSAKLDYLLYALLFLTTAGFFAGRGSNFYTEWKEAVMLKLASVETNPVADYSGH